MMKYLLICCAFLCFGVRIQAQNPHSKKVSELLEKANKFWTTRAFDKAEEQYKKVLETDKTVQIAHLRLAQLYAVEKKEPLVKAHYLQAVATTERPPESFQALQWLAKDYFDKERYDSSRYYSKQLMDLADPKKNTVLLKNAERMYQSSEFALKALQAPNAFHSERLGEEVNALRMQFFPVLTADNEKIIFTGINSAGNEDIFISEWHNQKWGRPIGLSAVINTTDNEGTCSISADGRTLVFTGCNRSDGLGSCDLYITYLSGQQWSKPINLGGVVNSRFWESQPSLSADGRSLYFASNRPGGEGNNDIWVTKRGQDGNWLPPVNLGNVINTPEDEAAPFIHANQVTLIYASKGKIGMGGYDLFLTNFENDSWVEPTNLGYPINRVSDQVGMFITSDGKQAFYTEYGKGATGDRTATIHQFLLPKQLQEQLRPTTYFKGKVLDATSKKPLHALLRLYDLESGALVSQFSSDGNMGDFLIVVNRDKEYSLYIEKEGYLFKSYIISTTTDQTTVEKDVFIEPIEKDRVEVLSNIYFNSGAYQLDDRSKVELQKMLHFLQQNKSLRIQISGHTDDVGTETDNLALSEKRAEAVAKYLFENGIDKNRIEWKGYGESAPKVPNTTEITRKINRRIEWRIL